jgi:archaeosine-15-forming tRNA-guanine transglycosylase
MLPVMVVDQNAIPDGLREHYQFSEADEAWLLQIDDVRRHPATRGLVSALARQKERCATLRAHVFSLIATYGATDLGLGEEP